MLSFRECPGLGLGQFKCRLRGELDHELQVAFMVALPAGSFSQCPAAENLLSPSGRLFWNVNRGAPDGRVVDTITRLGSRMDDILAETQSAAPREALICLLSVSSGGNN